MTPYGYNIFSRVCLHFVLSCATHRLPITTDQSLPDHLPHVSTLRALFMRHLDINSIPKRSFFRLLKYFATDEREREKLEEFSSPEGAVGGPSLSRDIRQLRETGTGRVGRLYDSSPSHDPRGSERVSLGARAARPHFRSLPTSSSSRIFDR